MPRLKRGMTGEADMQTHSRGDIAPELCQQIVPRNSEGAGNAGRLARPQPRMRDKKAHELVTTGLPKRSGTPCANGFNGFLRALSGDRAFLSPSPANHPADLTPASRRQDHTTLPSAFRAFVACAKRVHRIPHPTFVTIAKRPLLSGRDARTNEVCLPRRGSEIFFPERLDS
jgi:hypothetical protein